MTTTKKTIATKYDEVATVPAIADNSEWVQFLTVQADKLRSKKATNRKPSAQAQKNAVSAENIKNFLETADSPVTISEIIENTNDENLTPARTASILKTMIDSGTAEKKKSKAGLQTYRLIESIDIEIEGLEAPPEIEIGEVETPTV